MNFLKVLFLFCFLLSGCHNNEKEVSSSFSKIILIDPGHGGKDNGASVDGVLEDEINLQVSLYLYKLLVEQGFITFITRTGDYDLSKLNAINHKVQDLNNRVKMINDNKVDLFVSLHLNTYLDTSVSGAQVFYQHNNQQSEQYAKILQTEINNLYEKQRKAKVGDFYILENSNQPGVLIEMGFLSSFFDRNNLIKKDFQQLIAETIYRSIKIFFEL